VKGSDDVQVREGEKGKEGGKEGAMREGGRRKKE
jgi:hypothetical protein